jgi:predicted Zn-dependent protease
MHTTPRSRPSPSPRARALRSLAAALLAGSIAPASAGASWIDNPHESIAVPLESPQLGIARARWLLERQATERAIAALKKVVARYPNADEAHRLLAALTSAQGRADRTDPQAVPPHARD